MKKSSNIERRRIKPPFVPCSGMRVQPIVYPRRQGVVVRAGEQQSEVKWDHDGRVQVVSNKWIEEVQK